MPYNSSPKKCGFCQRPATGTREERDRKGWRIVAACDIHRDEPEVRLEDRTTLELDVAS